MTEIISSSSNHLSMAERNGGVTVRAVLFSLFLAALFGLCIPIVDFQMSNTFLGAMHMPANALATLLLLLVNLLLRPFTHRRTIPLLQCSPNGS